MGPGLRRDDGASGASLQLICPTGARCKMLSTALRKNIPIFRNSDSAYYLRRSAPSKGRIAIAVDVGRNVVDGQIAVRRAASARTAKSCGPGALKLGAQVVGQLQRLRGVDGGNSAQFTEESTL
jgi:hypothetical protein